MILGGLARDLHCVHLLHLRHLHLVHMHRVHLVSMHGVLHRLLHVLRVRHTARHAVRLLNVRHVLHVLLLRDMRVRRHFFIPSSPFPTVEARPEISVKHVGKGLIHGANSL